MMKKKINLQKIGKKFTLVFSIMIVAGVAFAEPRINAKVNSSQVSLNDRLTLTLEISGVQNVSSPGNINIPNFQVQRAGQTRSIQWINGQTTSLLSFNYILTPTKAGTFKIPAITLNQDGKSISTEPIDVVVTNVASVPPPTQQQKGTAQAQNPNVNVPTEGLKPVFMTAKVNKSKAYVGEQILLTVQFLRRPNVRLSSQPRYIEPDMTGFLVEPLEQQEFNTTLNGVSYQATELRYALFPTSDGEFAIGNASINLSVRSTRDPFDPNSFFESFFGRSRTVNLKTKAIPIRVRALPKEKPLGFSGAVGQFKIRSKVDTLEAAVGKPLNLTVTIEGVGNVKSLKEPTLPNLSSFRTYETITNTNVNKKSKFFNGTKEFKTLLIPQVSGQIKIPSIPFTYFDPQEHQYKTSSTGEITLQVEPGSIASADQDPGYQGQPGQAIEGVRVVEKDIRFLKTGDIYSADESTFPFRVFLIANAIPPIFAIGAVLAIVRSRHRVTHAADYRSRKAYKKAKQILKQAEKEMNSLDANQFYARLAAALSGFLSDKLHISTIGMTWESLNSKLKDRGIDEQIRNEIHTVLNESDMARFASSSFSDVDRDESLERIYSVLNQLNNNL